MEFSEVIRRRRMVRHYSDRSLTPEVVERVLASALRVPSAGFSQGWAFLALTDLADVVHCGQWGRHGNLVHGHAGGRTPLREAKPSGAVLFRRLVTERGAGHPRSVARPVPASPWLRARYWRTSVGEASAWPFVDRWILNLIVRIHREFLNGAAQQEPHPMRGTQFPPGTAVTARATPHDLSLPHIGGEGMARWCSMAVMAKAGLFSEADLRRVAGDRSFDRGLSYLDAVGDVEIGVDEITATVYGSDAYEVVLDIGEGAVSGQCSCPYGKEGFFCKHLVAVGLSVLGQPGGGSAPAGG